MTIAKQVIQTIVHLALNAEGVLTHAWKVTHFAVLEDDKEISRGASGQENVEPTDLAAALPAHADVVAQLGQKDAAHQEAAGAAAKALEDAKAAHTEDVAALNAQVEQFKTALQAMTDDRDAVKRKLDAVTAHIVEAAKAVSG